MTKYRAIEGADCIDDSVRVASFEGGFSTDVSATVVEEAIGALGEINGRQVSEQIVGEIFSHFCVGK